jgi:hypothetical protein
MCEPPARVGRVGTGPCEDLWRAALCPIASLGLASCFADLNLNNGLRIYRV